MSSYRLSLARYLAPNFTNRNTVSIKLGYRVFNNNRMYRPSIFRSVSGTTLPCRCSIGQTYSKESSLWLLYEVERIREMQEKQQNGLLLTRGMWRFEKGNLNSYVLKGKMQFQNITKRFEIFIPEVLGSTTLLSEEGIEGVFSEIKIRSAHPNDLPPPRRDGYWQAYITKAGGSTEIEVEVTLTAQSESLLDHLKAVRVDIRYVSYGPHGRTQHCQQVILPLKFPDPRKKLTWQRLDSGVQLLPIPTHLLCHLDDPLSVMETYVKHHVQPGDVLAMGETPLAIMQGRFRHPSGVTPGWLARLICRLFHPTSSLATACGMQALVDLVGGLRVLFAALGAIVARLLLGKRGIFYVLAGQQARLIDDVTGTLPPYDQFISLGPVRVKDTVEALRAKTGCDVAVVDVNDLRRVQILAASSGVNKEGLTAALMDNPAGNGDEQTPLVLVRGLV